MIGPRADSVVRDWYGGTPPYPYVTGRQGIAEKLAGTNVNVTYVLNDNGGAATSAAASSDVAIVFVGNHPTCGEPYPPWGTCPSPYEGREQVDRLYIGLEPAQLALVQSVAAANPRTIVVLVSSFPQAIGWIDANVPAIVHVANSGQELGHAVADVLFGDYNPGGHTTTTWYQSETDIPTAITDYDITKGTTYWYFTGTPLYPFRLRPVVRDLRVREPEPERPDAAGVRQRRRRARRDQHQRGRRRRGRSALRQLSGIGGAAAAAAAARLSARQRRGRRDGARDAAAARGDLAYWNENAGRFTVEDSNSVEVQLGASSRDIRFRIPLAVTR